MGCPFRHGLHGHCVLTAQKKKKGYIALVEDFTEFGPASTIFRRGVSVSARTSRTLPFDANFFFSYIALIEDFTEFGLASTIFRRGVSVSARTSRTLPFDEKKKMGYIALVE